MTASKRVYELYTHINLKSSRRRRRRHLLKWNFRHAWFRFLKILIFLFFKLWLHIDQFLHTLNFISFYNATASNIDQSLLLWHIVNLTYRYKLRTFFVNSFTYCFMSTESEVMNGSLLTQLRTCSERNIHDNIFDLFFFAFFGWVFLDHQDRRQKREGTKMVNKL